MLLRWRHTILLVVSVALAGFVAPTVAASEGTGTPGDAARVRTDEVCFTVHNAGDPVASGIHGVRYYATAPGPDTNVIILVHGAAGPPRSFAENPGGTNWFWDVRPDFSVARNLARAGYLVIAYDRLGYGKSPYLRPKGAGYTLDVSGARAMLHEIVTQVKAGSYAFATNGQCSPPDTPGRGVGHAAPAVVIIGDSAGGAIVSGYPGTYHDVAAAVQEGWNNQGIPAEAAAYWAPVFAPDYLSGSDYVRLVPDHESCTKLALYPEGVLHSLRPTYCHDGYGPAPAGEVLNMPRAYAENLASIKNVGPGLPVLLVNGDHDYLFPPEANAKEFAYWSANCGCDVEAWTQAGSGHAFVAHASMPTFTAKVVDWLASKSLPGR